VLPYPTAPLFALKCGASILPINFAVFQFATIPPSSPDGESLSGELSDHAFFDKKCGAYILPSNFVVFSFATIPRRHPTRDLCQVSYPTTRFFYKKCGAYVLPFNSVVFAFATIPPSSPDWQSLSGELSDRAFFWLKMWRVHLADQFCRFLICNDPPRRHPTRDFCRVSYPTAHFCD
jgi:hypothetical protein